MSLPLLPRSVSEKDDEIGAAAAVDAVGQNEEDDRLLSQSGDDAGLTPKDGARRGRVEMVAERVLVGPIPFSL